MLGFLRRPRQDRAGLVLYGIAVAAARAPYFYTALAVPDTLDGRFDMVGLHAFLLMRRLSQAARPGPALAQAVFDAMFQDMDHSLRELGVGDLSVSKKIKQMWEAFHGRAAAYEAAFAAGADPAALPAALARNVWRGAATPHAADLARIARAQDAHLAAQTLPAFADGRADFLPPETAA